MVKPRYRWPRLGAWRRGFRANVRPRAGSGSGGPRARPGLATLSLEPGPAQINLAIC
jgi:hypothetical protein